VRKVFFIKMEAAAAFASLRDAYIKLRDTHGASTILLLSDMLALEHSLLKISLQCHVKTQEAKLNSLSSFSLTKDVEELTKTLRSKLTTLTSAKSDETSAFSTAAQKQLDGNDDKGDVFMIPDEKSTEIKNETKSSHTMDESKERSEE